MVSVAKFDQWQSTAGVTRNAVLQVVQSISTTPVVVQSNSPVDIGVSASITPSSATSKILAFWNIQGETQASNGGFTASLVRNSTTVFNNSGLNYDNYLSTSADIVSSRMYLDSPATTSAITYKIQCSTYSTVSVRFQNNTLPSTLVLMEIAA